MNAYELTDYIIHKNKIEQVLEKLNCCGIREHYKEYRCGLPNDYNKNRVSIKKDTLKIRIFEHEDVVRGNFYTLIMYIDKCSFAQSVRKLHEILDIKYTYNYKKETIEKKINILDVFEKIKRRNDYSKDVLNIYQSNIFNNIIQIPYLNWVKEGILPNTQDEFGIGFSREQNRVFIPHRYWCGHNDEIVGAMGRTLIKNCEDFDIPKYFPLKKFPKSMNIYGIQENFKHIQKAGYVNVFESEKSTLKRHSRLDKTGSSLGGHEISEEQAKILISLNVDIIIIMDKDIGINYVRKLCENFYGIRKVFYVYDTLGLLGEKESPADKHDKIFKVLWNRKVEYNKEEHDKYLKYIESCKNEN